MRTTKKKRKSPTTTTKKKTTRKKKKKTRKKRTRNKLRALAIAGFLILGLPAAPPSRAQDSNRDKKAEAELRTIHGAVLDKDENPAPSSIVYLLNRKTQAVRTYIADGSGNYRFSGLDPNADYEVHAEHGDLVSGTRTITSFDSRRDMELTFKLTKKRPPEAQKAIP
jgi:Carboxypeptidase regulatory-like domain